MTESCQNIARIIQKHPWNRKNTSLVSCQNMPEKYGNVFNKTLEIMLKKSGAVLEKNI